MRRSTFEREISRRGLLKSGASVGLGVALGLSCSQDDASEPADPGIDGPRPDIVVITLDALRAISLPMYGCPRNTAPFLQALSERSTRYASCYSSATWTRPSVVGLLTGLLPHQHQSNHIDVPVPASLPSFATVARDAGYDTGFFTANPILGESFGMEKHFAHASWAAAKGHSGEKLVAECEAWLGGLSDAPACAYLHIYQPHGPYDPPRQYVEQAFHEAGAAPPSAAYLEPHQHDVDLALGSFNILGRIPFYEGLVGGSRDPLHYLLMYEANILYADALTRQLVETWQRLRPAERTIFIVTSDHGEAFGEQAIFCDHGTILQETMIRVPLLIHDTADPRGRVVSTPVSHLDLPTTIARWVGSDARLGGYGEPIVSPREGRRDTNRPIVSQQLSERRGPLGQGEAGWALTRDAWRLVYNDAPTFGNHTLVATEAGRAPRVQRPRVAVPRPATSLQHPQPLADGVTLESLAFLATFLDPSAAQPVAGHVRVRAGAEGTLALRIRVARKEPLSIGTFACSAGRIAIEATLGPIALSEDEAGVGALVEGAWTPVSAKAQSGAVHTWRPLFCFTVRTPVAIGADVNLVGGALEPPVALPGEPVRGRIAVELRRTLEDAPAPAWRVVGANGQLVAEGTCSRLRDHIAAEAPPKDEQIRQLLRAGFRFEERFEVHLPETTPPGPYRVELVMPDGPHAEVVGRLEIAAGRAEALDGLIEAHASIEACALLTRDARPDLLTTPRLDAPLRRAAARYPEAGEIPFLQAQLTSDPERRRALLLEALARTPFHRSALEQATASPWGAAHAATLRKLTPQHTCRFVFGRTMLLYGFDVERVDAESGHVDLSLYWEARATTRDTLTAEVWLNHLAADGTRESASRSWFVGGDQHPNHTLQTGEACKETIRLPLPQRQKHFSLTLLLFPHWDYAFWDQKNKHYLAVVDHEGADKESARLGNFVLRELPKAATNRLDAKRRDRASYRLYDVASDPLETTNLVDANPEVFEALQAELLALIEMADAEGATDATGRREMSDELNNELRALGYIE